MKKSLFTLFVFLPIFVASQTVPVDKQYHIGAGIVIGTWGTFAGNSLNLDAERSAAFGIGAVFVAGLGKELWDELDYGGFDMKDLGATMIGGAVGVGLTYAGLKIFKKNKPVIVARKNDLRIGVNIKF